MEQQTMEPIEGEFKPTAITVKDNDLMPALTVEDAVIRYEQFNKFVSEIMRDGVDFGKIPGTSKPTLLKPGAEKLTTFFGFTVKYVDEKIIEDFDKPLFYYRRKCQLWRSDHLIAEASGSCNSMEDRYAWRWVEPHEVPSDLDKKNLKKKISTIGTFAWMYDKRETTGDYGKSEEYWEQFDKAIQNKTVKTVEKVQHWNNKEATYYEIESVLYRVPNENIFTLVNTFLKMADKRALIAATLIACNASEYFTQDMEDIVDASFVEDKPATTRKEQPKQAQKKVDPEQQSDPSNDLDTASLESSDINLVKSAAVGLATNEKFPPDKYLAFAEKLGFEQKTAIEIKNDNGGNFNQAVLTIIELDDKNEEYGQDKSDIPF